MLKEYTEVETCILYIAEKDNKETTVMQLNQIYIILLLKEECKLMSCMFIKKHRADLYGGVDSQGFPHQYVEFTAYRIFQ